MSPRWGDYQLDLPLGKANIAADAAACSEPIKLYPRFVLEAVQAAQATVLPFQGMAKVEPSSQAGASLLFDQQEAYVTATCAPQTQIVYPSAPWACESEYQRDLFEMPQGGA